MNHTTLPVAQDNNLPSALRRTLDTIVQKATLLGRNPSTIQLLAVSKMQSIESIRTLYDAGQKAFGENYWQEAVEKQNALADLDIEWHFIGHLQSRKAKDVARNFHWVHTVDRAELFPRLQEGAMQAGRNLQICLQINVSHEQSKHGMEESELLSVALAINQFPSLILRGLMAIPAPILNLSAEAKFTAQRQPFSCLARLLQQLRDTKALQHQPLDTLSMGMSDDYPAAIVEGATIIRLGTALFGARS